MRHFDTTHIKENMKTTLIVIALYATIIAITIMAW